MSEHNGNLMTLQSGLDALSQLGMTFQGQRSLYTALGWKKDLGPDDFLNKYLRQDLAARLVDIFPEYTWRQPPRVTDDAEADPLTPFEAAYEALATRLRLTHIWTTLDRLAGLGQYAVLLLGVADGRPLQTPITRARDVAYVSAYGQRSAEITRLEEDPQQPGFGRPLTYTIDLTRRTEGGLTTPRGRAPATMILPVHASRVVHFAEMPLDGAVYGLPRLERVFNRLDDLEKLLGGSAEMFWQGGRGNIVAALRDGAAIPDDATKEELRRQIDEWTHGLRQWLRVSGIDVTRLPSSLASPKDAIEAQATIIAAAAGVPQRILMGSERGELASTQDQVAWESTIQARQKSLIEPMLIRATIDRLIAWGVLPEPAGGVYEVVWPQGRVLDPLRQAEIAERMARAVGTYVEGQGELVMPVGEFREHALGLHALPDAGVLDEELDREDEGEDT